MRLRKILHNLLTSACVLAMACVLIVSETVPARAAEKEGAVINIVYDDSGSMSGGTTRWSQAKYAIEVFTAMMGPEDTVNVFPMNNYSSLSGPTEDPSRYFTLKGTENGQKRVDKVDSELNGQGGTPFVPVESAAAVLKKASATDKWLIVLTDGAFDEPQEYTESQLAGFAASGMKVVFISVDIPSDSSATFASLDDGQNFLAYNTNEQDILQTVTTVAQQIFSLQQVPLVSSNPYTFDADIPLSKLIVLAQGEKADVKDLKNDGKNISQKPETVNVSVLDSSPYKPEPDSMVAPGLEGKVVSYVASDPKKPMASGTYTFDATTSDVQVFFEPGVEIQAQLNAGGDVGTKNILEIDELSANGSTLNLKFINPLTGDEIDRNASALLQGADLYLNVTDGQGNTQKYSDGDTVALNPGNYSLEAVSTFPSRVTFRSGKKEVKITSPAPLVKFSSNTGYSLSAKDLSTDVPVEFFLMKADGSSYSPDELRSLKVSMQGTPGIDWQVTPLDNAGLYQAVPRYTNENGSASIENAVMTGEVAVTDAEGKPHTFITDIVLDREIPVELLLEVQLPDDQMDEDGKSYTFNSSVLGIGPDNPYILVSAAVTNPDGSTRLLTDEEWQAGVEGFSFSGIQSDPGFWDRIYRLFLTQSINFAVEPGDEASTYRLYLDGRTPVNVLPGLLDVDITLTIPSNAGITEKGSAQTSFSVKPQSFWAYLGTFILVLLALILLVIFIVLLIRKKRFSSKFRPRRVFIIGGFAGAVPKAPVVNHPPVRFEKHPLNLLKPQEATFSIDLTSFLLGNPKVEVEAADATHVIITNLESLAKAVPNGMFGGISLSVLAKKKSTLTAEINKSHLDFKDPKGNKIQIWFSDPAVPGGPKKKKKK